ncbi:hypothetical protein GCM10010259_58200 [Streptomyces daghestanicus]|uniref:Secreted protein n=2 Tax=Streptomyces TaxID=1883 RepID=A0ABQ3PU56_9ACTN|nr:hypothetical protein GCM10010240_57810 [Streptomyces griseoviridis]GGU59686.1 hypothetical protein GCM10010259_58200 [Streptomyces daghestanicus]GHI28547.1 hypothetical protein Sdagh_02770 [Streptomyces daghestanicus]
MTGTRPQGGFDRSDSCSTLADMSWTRRGFAALAVCVLLLTGSAGCGTSDTDGPERPAVTAAAGRLLDDTDEDGRRLREVGREDAPEVGIEVQPEADGDWRVRLTVRGFRFSPAGTPAEAVAGRGLAYLYVDGALVARLRDPAHRLAAGLVPRGTHHVTARLYADDGTVWAVDGEPVENTADITASGVTDAADAPSPADDPSPADARGTADGPSPADARGAADVPDPVDARGAADAVDDTEPARDPAVPAGPAHPARTAHRKAGTTAAPAAPEPPTPDPRSRDADGKAS